MYRRQESDVSAQGGGGAERAQSASRRRWWNWPLRSLGAVVVAIGLLTLPLACTTRIYPPSDVSDPVTVYLLDHGRTPSLILPGEDGQPVRYAYGDWNWYALGNTGLWSGIRALLWPTAGTLGRRELSGPLDLPNLRRQVHVGIEHAYPITVDRQRARALRERLDQQFFGRSDTLVENPRAGLHFVPDPRSYTYCHNSNHALARWLRELGCRTSGPALSSRWRIDQP